LVLEKFKVFNKQVTKKEYNEIKEKIISQLGYYKHPKQLTKEDIDWLRTNIRQFDRKVLKEIVENSVLPDKPKEEDE
jgi:hypothetical protein